MVFLILSMGLFSGIGEKVGTFGASMVFFSLMLFGAIFTFLTLIFGHDTDSGGDIGHGDVSGDHDVTAEAPSKFSLRTLLFFITGFGAIGFLTQLKTRNTFISSIAGVLGGIVMAAIGYFIVRIFYAQQATSITTSADIINSVGEVITTIPKDGMGEVSITAAGKLLSKSARADDNSEIKSGSRIKVVNISGSCVTVTRVGDCPRFTERSS